MKPSLRLAVVPILAATVFTAPIRATSAAQVDTTVDGIFNLFRQAYDDVHAYIEQTIQDVVTALPGELDNALNDALGELGWVDPNQIRAEIAEQLATPIDGDLAQSDPVYAAVETANEIDRQLTRAQVDAMLSQDGQANTQNKLTWMETTIDQIQQHADAAQAAVSTQDAIKQMAQQTALQSDVLGAVQAELLQSRQDAQLTNLNLANLSHTLDQETRARRLQDLGSALDTLQISSQARLF